MAKSFKCRSCKVIFNKRQNLTEHVRVMHQKLMKVRLGDGPEMTIERQDDGDFKCPIGNCDYHQQNSRYVRDHMQRCDGVGHVTKVIVAPYSGTATVVPTGEELELHEKLNKYNLMWNKRCGILVCKKCNSGVPLDQVRSHFDNENDVCRWTKPEVLEDLHEYSTMITDSNEPPEYVQGRKCEPVQGLLMYNGFTCTICHKSWPSKKTMKNHFSTTHSSGHVDKEARKAYRIAHSQGDKCQTFYGHIHQNYFAVLPYRRPEAVEPVLAPERSLTPTDDDHREAVKKMLEKLQKHVTEEAATRLHDGTRKDIANWIFVTGIHDYVEGLIEEGKTHGEMVVVSGDEAESVNVMVRFIASWINTVMKRLHRTGQFLKRLAMAETSEMEDNKGMMPLQEKVTVFKYARIISTFIWFLVIQAEDPVDGKMRMHNRTKNLLLSLRDIVLPMKGPEKNPGRGEAMEYFDISNDPICQHVSAILCAVFQTPVGGFAQQYQYPPMQFLALSTVKANGSYHEPNLVTHLIAAMQYGTRLAFVEQYLDQPREEFDPDSDPMAPINDDVSKFEWLRKNGPGPFSYVRQLMHHLSTVILSEALPDTTFWVDQAKETLEVENKRVTISGIRNCIHIQDKLAHSDLSQMIEGCKMPAFDLDLYKDDSSSREPYTNFLDHSEMEHKKYGLHLLKEWVKRRDVHGLLKPTWKGGLGEDDSMYDEKIWDEAGMLRWLDMYDKLQERLYFLYHVASGQPLRGTEEATTLLVNTRVNQRNFYLRAGRFAFLMWYHKSRNIMGKNKARMTFLPKGHSFIWFYFIGFLRPVAQFFLKALGNAERAEQMTTKMWISTSKGPLGTSDFTAILKRMFVEGGVAPLGIAPWRHVTVAIVDAHIKDNSKLFREDDIIDCQRGHSSHTANTVYGGTGGYEVDRDSEKKYEAASIVMHKFWEIDSLLQTGFAPVLPLERIIPSSELVQNALTLYTGDEKCGTRDPFQAEWLGMVFDRNYDMLVVARTGSGKSLGYMLPPLVEYTGMTVIVQPLKSLVAETCDALKAKGVRYLHYTSETKKIEDWTRAVVVTTDIAGTEGFYNVLRGKKMNRIVIDEAHCYEDDEEYRKYAHGVARLRGLNAPFVFMTATMQVGHESVLWDLFSIVNVKVKREDTGRAELQFTLMEPSDWKMMIKDIGQTSTRPQLVSRDRNILFIENIKECEEAKKDLQKLHPDLPITLYHSKLRDEEAENNVKFWKTTPKCLMIATSGFGAGINYKHVRNVMISGVPENEKEVNKCIQEAGRAGRDGAAANVWIYPIGEPEEGSFGARLHLPEQCIIGTFAELLDGEHRTCAMVGCQNICNHCHAKGKAVNAKRKAEEAAVPSGTQAVMPGMQPMYLANAKRARTKDSIVTQIGLEIENVRKEMAKVCGLCLAKHKKKVYHEGRCGEVGGACLQCLGGHYRRDCLADQMSVTLERHGTALNFMCHFCGLPTKWSEDGCFHETSTEGKRQSCDSGLQNVCDPYCWWYIHNKKNLVSAIVRKLEFKGRSINVSGAGVKDFQEWLGSHGWLGCPWANMVTLFIVLRHPYIRKRAV